MRLNRKTIDDVMTKVKNHHYQVRGHHYMWPSNWMDPLIIRTSVTFESYLPSAHNRMTTLLDPPSLLAAIAPPQLHIQTCNRCRDQLSAVAAVGVRGDVRGRARRAVRVGHQPPQPVLRRKQEARRGERPLRTYARKFPWGRGTCPLQHTRPAEVFVILFMLTLLPFSACQ